MAFNASISGINAGQQEMSVISNNIVNAGTIGFKKLKDSPSYSQAQCRARNPVQGKVWS